MSKRGRSESVSESAKKPRLHYIDEIRFNKCQMIIRDVIKKLLKLEGQKTVPEYFVGATYPDPPAPAQKWVRGRPVRIGSRDKIAEIIYAAYHETPVEREKREREGLEPDTHSTVFVRNELLPLGWAIFDPDGKEGLKSLFQGGAEGEPLKLEVDRKEIYESHGINDINNIMIITPENSINTHQGYGGDEGKAYDDPYNPGFCSIFVFIFVCFYIRNKNEADWVKRWKEILKKMQKPVKNVIFLDEDGNPRPHDPRSSKILRATMLGQEVYENIVEENSGTTIAEDAIHQVNVMLENMLMEDPNDMMTKGPDGHDMMTEHPDDDMDGGGGQRSPKRVIKKKNKKKTKSRGRRRARRSIARTSKARISKARRSRARTSKARRSKARTSKARRSRARGSKARGSKARGSKARGSK